MPRISHRRLRYAAPFGVVGVVALVAAIPSLSAGATTPDLPAISAQQLIAQIQQVNVPALQGSVRWTADLGLPDLGGLTSGSGGQVAGSSGFDPTTLLSGTHDIEVWTAGDQQRLALPRTMGETDLVRNGTQAWLYDSASQRVTHYQTSQPTSQPAAAPSGGTASGDTASGEAASGGVALTPEQEAAKLLADLAPTTDVTVAPGADVAGQHTYLLTLAPEAGSTAAQTTLSHITISVDAANSLPLDVAVYAWGNTSPVVELGYTTVSFTTPAASNFSPPVGTSTSEQTVSPRGGGQASPGSQGAGSQGGSPTVTGGPWAWVVTLHQSDSIPGGLNQGNGPAGSESPLNSGAVQGATIAVSGSFGTGRLLHTSTVNALFLPDGRVLAGFVSPTVLEAAAGPATS